LFGTVNRKTHTVNTKNTSYSFHEPVLCITPREKKHVETRTFMTDSRRHVYWSQLVTVYTSDLNLHSGRTGNYDMTSYVSIEVCKEKKLYPIELGK